MTIKTIWQQGEDAGEVSPERTETHNIAVQGYWLERSEGSYSVDPVTGEITDTRPRRALNRVVYVTQELAERLLRKAKPESFDEIWAILKAGGRVETAFNGYWVSK